MVTNIIPYDVVVDMVEALFRRENPDVLNNQPRSGGLMFLGADYYLSMEEWIKDNFNCWPDSDRTVFIFHSEHEALIFRLKYSS